MYAYTPRAFEHVQEYYDVMSLSLKLFKEISFCWGNNLLFLTLYNQELKLLSFTSQHVLASCER